MAGERKERRGGGGRLVKAQSKERAAGGEKTGQSVGLFSFAFNYLYNEEREQISSCRGVTLKVLPLCRRTLADPGGAVT